MNAGDFAAESGSPGANDHKERTAAGVEPPARTPSRSTDEIESPLTRFAELGSAFSERIRGRPLAFLALALGAGFAIGGALSFRGGRLALSVAARQVGRELLKQVL